MVSLRAKLVNLYFRKTLKPVLLHQRDPQEVRDRTERSAIGFLPKEVTLKAQQAPIKGEWNTRSTPTDDGEILKDSQSKRVILYLHGGGYVFGSPKTHRSLTHALCLQADATVFSLDYRLAPEHKCPAALEDALAAYQWLLNGGAAPENLVIAGDSAGGGLALATLQALRDQGLPLPACAILYSPYADLAMTGRSIFANKERDAMFNLETMLNSGKFYAGDLPLNDLRCSPLYGDMAGLPPMKVFASSDEMLFDDAVRIVEKVKTQGGQATLVSEAGIVHAWPVFYALMPEAKKTVADSGAFIRQCTAV